MSLRDRMKRLLKATEEPGAVFYTEDGERISYTHDDFFEALKAAIADEEHWLVSAAHRANTQLGTPGLLWALTSSRERPEPFSQDLSSKD
jgi:hypothetical protein